MHGGVSTLIWLLLYTTLGTAITIDLDALYDVDYGTCTSQQLDTVRSELAKTFTLVDRCHDVAKQLQGDSFALVTSTERWAHAARFGWGTDNMKTVKQSPGHVTYEDGDKQRLTLVMGTLWQAKIFLDPPPTEEGQIPENRPYLGCDLGAFDLETSPDGAPVLRRTREGASDVVISDREYGCTCALGGKLHKDPSSAAIRHCPFPYRCKRPAHMFTFWSRPSVRLPSGDGAASQLLRPFRC